MKALEIMVKDVVTIPLDMKVNEIAKLFYEKKISGAPVVDDKNQIVGIVSKSDLMKKVAGPHLPAHIEILGSIIFLKEPHQMEEEFKKVFAVTAGDIMTEHVFTVAPDEELNNIVNLMVERKINRVPVVENKKIVGIVSRDDIVKNMLN